MRHLIHLAVRSAWNRRLTLAATVVAIALSVTLLLGVERVRHDARESFALAVSGTDLVVGARTGPVQLMLYTVYRIGDASNNMRWESFREISALPGVAWAVPLSLGDSHRGFPVLGTSSGYFEHFRYGAGSALQWSQGAIFKGLFDAVIGAEVARRLGYRVGDRIVLSHGAGDIVLAQHVDRPFIVTGILEATGTPVDRTVHVSLEALEAIHLDWQGGGPVPGLSIPAEFLRKFDLRPKAITGALLGLEQRSDVFRVQRVINDYAGEPLLAVLPGVALDQLWQAIGVAEKSLVLISAMVVVVGLCGLVAVMLAGINERRRELAILRSAGAGPMKILSLLILEGVCITCVGALLGLVLLGALAQLLAPFLRTEYGLVWQTAFLSPGEALLLAMVVASGCLASVVPGYRAYQVSLADGLTPNV